MTDILSSARNYLRIYVKLSKRKKRGISDNLSTTSRNLGRNLYFVPENFFFSTSKMFNTMLRDISKSYSLHVWLKLSRNTAVGPDMCIKIRASLVETRECNYLAPRRTVLWKKWIKQNELNVQRYARTMGFSSDTKVIFIENTQLLKYLKRRKKEKIQTTR